jgi:hypothetical protein
MTHAERDASQDAARVLGRNAAVLALARPPEEIIRAEAARAPA